MAIHVVAILTPKSDRVNEVLDAFAEVSPLVHDEPGCEIYAAHTDGHVVIMIEQWTTRSDLDAHAVGAPLARLIELTSDVLEHPYDVWILDAVPLGDAIKGVVDAGTTP
jgi:quinol monooxygenase YgiN